MKRAIAVVAGMILIGLMLTGCATTQSGQLKVTFNTPDKGKIKSLIINDFKKLEYKVVSESNDSVTLEGKRLGYTGADRMHAIFNMVRTDDSTTVLIHAYLLSAAGFGRTTYAEDVTYGNTGAELQKILERIKVQVESE